MSQSNTGFDVLRLPLLGRCLKWRHARVALQVPLLILAALIIYDGLFGPQLAPKNLAGVLPWVHWRGFVALALLVAGNLFCMACPFMLPRRLAKRLLPVNLPWPRWLRAKWLAVGLLIAFFWGYEYFDLWGSPWLTAWIVAGYFVAAFVVDGLFRGAAFCKYVCPIGQFHFVNSLASPLEIQVRDADTCAHCATKDCIKGRGELPGCELWLFQERKVGNMDCTFCLDCVHACPHDNVGILARTPGSELWRDPRRSGVGRFGRRVDVAALALVLTFGAFANAFGMVRPVYVLERWLAQLLGTSSEAAVLAVVFGLGLVALPLALVGLAAAASRALAGDPREALVAVATRYAYSLVPVGFGMWVAHYGYHFLTGALSIVPVAQSFLTDIGAPWLGRPLWGLGPVFPTAWLYPTEVALLYLGLLVSLLTAYRIAASRHSGRAAALRAFLPWGGLAFALFVAGAWLMAQPMEMRGTFGVG